MGVRYAPARNRHRPGDEARRVDGEGPAGDGDWGAAPAGNGAPALTTPVASTVTVAQDQAGAFAVGLSESWAKYQVPSRSLVANVPPPLIQP